MPYKLIAVDLDGTVLHSDKTISSYTLAVLKKCRAKGIQLAVATARSEQAARRYLDLLVPDVVISNGGALVRAGGQTVHRCMLPAEISDALCAFFFHQKGFRSVNVETETGFYVSWEKAASPDYSHAIHWDFPAPLGKDTYKISVELEQSEAAWEAAKRFPACVMTPFAGEDCYRFAHRHADKGSAIGKAAAYLNIPLERTVAFGDDFVDIGLLKACGKGIAMANAVGEVKQAADAVCEENDRDGVARWLEENLL